MRRKFIAFMLVAIFVLSSFVPVFAEIPYRNYHFNHWGVWVPSPLAYVPVRAIGATDIHPDLEPFDMPMDFAIDAYDYLYILDTGNNRIIVANADFDLVRIIDSFMLNGSTATFRNPQGVFVTRDRYIYVADTDNNRIVILDHYGAFIDVLENPQDVVLADDFVFTPLKVAVGRAGIVYVIARGTTEGMMIFDTYGEFLGFFGTIAVTINLRDLIWRIFSTQAQRDRQRLFIPTEFRGLDIDEYGFVFATHVSEGDDNQVKRLNPRGDDVLLNLNANVAIIGDTDWRPFGAFSGASVFTDIVARPNGMYSVLDATRSRVYTYDAEGNLLYVFGGPGSVGGMLERPVAINVIGDTILVLDAFRREIVIYEPTHYGSLINEAVRLLYLNDESGAVEKWHELILIDEHFSLAFAGIGRSYFVQGEYRLAMDYLRRGMDMRYYSLAFVRLRNEILRESLTYILTGGMVLIGLLILRKIYRVVRKYKRQAQAEA